LFVRGDSTLQILQLGRAPAFFSRWPDIVERQHGNELALRLALVLGGEICKSLRFRGCHLRVSNRAIRRLGLIHLLHGALRGNSRSFRLLLTSHRLGVRHFGSNARLLL
jgi:hypothetical protein